MIVLSVTQFSHLVYFLELIHIICILENAEEFSLHLHFDDERKKHRLNLKFWQEISVSIRKWLKWSRNYWTCFFHKLTTLQFNVSNENEAQLHSFLISLFFTNFFCHHHSQFLLASLSLNFFHHLVHILLVIYLPCATTHIYESQQPLLIHAKKKP